MAYPRRITKAERATRRMLSLWDDVKAARTLRELGGACADFEAELPEHEFAQDMIRYLVAKQARQLGFECPRMTDDECYAAFAAEYMAPQKELRFENRRQYAPLYVQPNAASRAAARQGLQARAAAPLSRRGGLTTQQAGRLGIGSGVARARDIVAGKRVNAHQVKRFCDSKQHERDRALAQGLEPKDSKALQSWLLWGGDPLCAQARAIVESQRAETARARARRLKNP
jgi:hypothetical protein